MITVTLPNTPTQYNAESVLKLHDDAWAAWNASYDAPTPRDVVAEAHRIVGRSLYHHAIHTHIEALNARSDAQNALIDALMVSR